MKTLLSFSFGAIALVAIPSLASAETCHETAEDAREICHPRDIFFMPGVDGVFYAPNAKGVQPFAGAGVHWAPYQWSHNTDHFGPSQGSIFIEASLLRSPSSSATMALIEGGTQLSFERNASRNYMIPYFGATIGALTHADLPSTGYGFPVLGLHAFYHPNLMIDLEGGYMFPFHELDTLRGPRANAVMRFSLW